MNIRYSIPSTYENAPYGTITKCILDQAIIIYIQVSKDKTEWIPLSEFLEIVFLPQIEDTSFINTCLKLYDQQACIDIITTKPDMTHLL